MHNCSCLWQINRFPTFLVSVKLRDNEKNERSARFDSERLASASADNSSREVNSCPVGAQHILLIVMYVPVRSMLYTPVRPSVCPCAWLRTWHSPPGRLLFNRSPHWPAMVSAHYAASHLVTCNEPSTAAAQPCQVSVIPSTNSPLLAVQRK